MTTLTELYTTAVDAKANALAAAQAAQAQLEQEKIEAGVTLLRRYLAKWEPLRSLLGIKGQPQHENGRIYLTGQSSVNSLPVNTMVHLDLPAYAHPDPRQQPNLVITLRSVTLPDAVNTVGIPPTLPTDGYADRLGALCTLWMDNYYRHQTEQAQSDAKQAERLAAATRVIELATAYQAELERYRISCREWAGEMVAKLWEPHVLWRIRYPALFVEDLADKLGVHIETVVCLEEPADILNQLQIGASATITVVDKEGRSSDREIGGFLDAERIVFQRHCYDGAMPYHRCYTTLAGVTVNVPAHGTTLIPVAPAFDGWQGFLQGQAPAWVDRWEDIDPAVLAKMTPAQLVETYGWRTQL